MRISGLVSFIKIHKSLILFVRLLALRYIILSGVKLSSFCCLARRGSWSCPCSFSKSSGLSPSLVVSLPHLPSNPHPYPPGDVWLTPPLCCPSILLLSFPLSPMTSASPLLVVAASDPLMIGPWKYCPWFPSVGNVQHSSPCPRPLVSM